MKKFFVLLLTCTMLLSVTSCGEKEPEKTAGEVRWPSSDLVNRLPKPETLNGKVVWESSEDFYVELINVTQEQYEDYVDACMDNGFVIDYYRDDEDFWAEDNEGYEVEVEYDIDMLIMGISIEEPYEEEPEDDELEDDETIEDSITTTTTTTTTKKETTTTRKKTTTAAQSDSIGSDFKAAMDAYETFMNRYVDFMKKYQANPTNLTLLADYATYISDYAKFCDEFAKWEDEDLNADELAYYMDVQARVTKKLLEVAG